jgi:hypothetical protein
MTFGPALSLGVLSLEEAVDVRIASRLDPETLARLAGEMTARSPDGLTFLRALRVPPGAPRISSLVRGARYAIVLARSVAADLAGGLDPDVWIDNRTQAVLAAPDARIRREIKGLAKMVDVRSFLETVTRLDGEAMAAVRRAGFVGDLVGFDAFATIRGDGAAKPSEIAEVLIGQAAPVQLVRLGLVLGSPGVAAEALGTLDTA